VTAKVGTVMLDCRDLDTMVAFWGRLLGLEEQARYPDYVWMSRLSDGGPALAFQRVPEPKTVKNRMHLDMAVPDLDDTVALVAELGGSRLADHEIGDFRWIVLADPEGNEFCVHA
jgi:predicted enzyme related to lactoylglutathione lyase